MVTLTSNSPEETLDIGARWGQSATLGLVIGLTGDLGAGKTHLVKGLARGLGLATRITSPSFALVNEYHVGRLPLFLLYLYRLDTPGQIVTAGLDDYLFSPAGVTVVEWIERWLPDLAANPDLLGSPAPRRSGLPPLFRRVVILTNGETSRQIVYEDFGA